MEIKDILIIGAGPSGIYAGFYAGMRGLTSIIVDQMPEAGGQLSALYPEKYIFDVAGIPKIKAKDLISQLLNQHNEFKEKSSFMLNTKIENITKDDDGFIATTSCGTIKARTILIAAGNGAFSPRPLGVNNEFEVGNIHYFVKDLSIFDNKKVAIFGGGDSAVDWGLALEKTSERVTIVHRRNEFRAHDHSVKLLKESKAIVKTPYSPYEINSENGKVSSVTIINNETKEVETIEVDDIICNFGFTTDLGPIKEWDIDIEGNKIKVDTRQETNIKGIFAIGDVCTYPGKTAIIANGFGEGPVAINAIYLHLNPGAKIGAMHSSSTMGGK